ncbi:multidrug ABC transporter ATP-binding protein [Pseudoclavibacter endophyticus]|uniref:Fatty acid ABC transporter ATP-binding/permease protein n=1 Tax=Pseudoclavibacter endophyticus TaxID=1778590 RepID=A0A6H9WQ20_9MICO|nr:ABC transporter ATP-binding protein [Pseudoclavibacter endophyticus]KAB1648201.1 ABC transporter ATP-binding protein [Pseudoclavibacter endophyticus]GGA70579.1 multidrug ABC transporter ATP-binding protein [Pseudoclavibacter endophyticus]
MSAIEHASADGGLSEEEAEELERAQEAMRQAGGGDGGMAGGKPKRFWPNFKRLLGLLAPFKVVLWSVVVMGAVAVILQVATPKILGEATNVIFEGAISAQLPEGLTQDMVVESLRAQGEDDFANMVGAMNITPGQGIDFERLGMIVLFVLALYLAAEFLMWLQGYLMNLIMVKAMYRLRGRVEEKIHRLPLSYFDRVQRGELLSRVTNDIDNMTQALQQSLSGAVTSILTVFGVLIMMFSISWRLALVALCIVPLTGIVIGVIGPRSQKAFTEQWRRTGRLNARVEESFSGHALVRVFGRERDARDAFEAENEQLFKASFKAQFLSGIIMPAMMYIGNLSYVALAVVGGLLVASGNLRLGDVQAFIQYSQQFTQPLTQLGGMAAVVQSATASAERVFELLDADEEEADAADAPEPARGDGTIEFRDVAFSYDPETTLIHDLNFTVKPGQTVAIVGPTGAGKTTLVNLVMRFYELDSGSIVLNGQDTAALRRHDVRARTGMVLQDPWLFQGTIRDNIRYGNEDAGEEEILVAAEATYVDRFVRTLPDGYETVLDEEASNVSAGEKQLITIARAFIADPEVLILDEATSSVDTRTELLLQKAMAALRQGRTSFVIAHRLSTIRDADLILVMENGGIVEQGTHDELLDAKGAYWRLYNSQFEQAAVEVDDTPVTTGAVSIPAPPPGGGMMG